LITTKKNSCNMPSSLFTFAFQKQDGSDST